MIRKRAKLLLKCCLFLVAALVLVAGGAVWRLSEGPVSANFLSPYIERALSASDGAYRVRVAKTVVRWEGLGKGIDIRAQSVQTVRADGEVLVTLPAISVRISAQALLGGQFAPSSIYVYRPSLHLVRGSSGQISFGIKRSKQAKPHFVPGILNALSGHKERKGPLAWLETVHIVDGQLTIDDAYLGRKWIAPSINMSLNRDARGLRADANLVLSIDKQRVRFSIRGAFDRAKDTAVVALRFRKFDPALFVSATGRLTALRHLEIPLSGTITVSAQGDGRITAADFSFSGKNGAIVMPQFYHRDLKIASLSTRGRFTNGLSHLQIDQFEVQLDGPVINVVGAMENSGGKLTYLGKATVSEIALKNLPKLWAEGVKTNARTWVKDNITDGRVKDLEVHFALEVFDGQDAEVKLNALDGRFKFENLKIRFQENFPPVEKVTGTASFSPADLKFRVASGELQGIKMTPSSVDIRGFDTPVDYMTIDTWIRGPLQNFLKVLDTKPFRFAENLGINVLAVKGQAKTNLKMIFPLNHDLTMDQIQLTANAQLVKVSWRKALFGLDLEQGRLQLDIDKTHMKLSGQGDLAKAPAQITWTEYFGQKAAFRRRFEIKAPFAVETLTKMGLSVDGLLTGSFDADFIVTGHDNGTNAITAKLDLKRTGFVVPVLRLTKKAGASGTADLSVMLKGHRLESIKSFVLKTGEIEAKGSGAFHKDGETVRELKLDKLVAPRTSLRARISGDVLGNKRVFVDGKSLDLTHVLRSKSDTGEVKLLPIAVKGRLDRLYFAPGRHVSDFSGEANYDGKIWRRILLAAKVAESKPVSIRLISDGRQRKLHVKAADAGAALRALNIADTIKNGTLDFTATKDDSRPGTSFVGTAKVANFTVTKAPVLARILALASFNGIGNLLSSDRGVAFQKFDVPFKYREGIITLSNGRSIGSQIGITFSGQLNFHRDVANLRGTIVPAYTINSVIGRIPLIGSAIVGEKGGGLLAASFSVRGPLTDPTLRVNPLSFLAPGFLRNLLSAAPDSAEDDEPAAPTRKPGSPDDATNSPSLYENGIGR